MWLLQGVPCSHSHHEAVKVMEQITPTLWQPHHFHKANTKLFSGANTSRCMTMPCSNVACKVASNVSITIDNFLTLMALLRCSVSQCCTIYSNVCQSCFDYSDRWFCSVVLLHYWFFLWTASHCVYVWNIDPEQNMAPWCEMKEGSYCAKGPMVILLISPIDFMGDWFIEIILRALLLVNKNHLLRKWVEQRDWKEAVLI